jgi:hypothetical protein
LNIYGYVGGNPVGYFDPKGLVGQAAEVISYAPQVVQSISPGIQHVVQVGVAANAATYAVSATGITSTTVAGTSAVVVGGAIVGAGAVGVGIGLGINEFIEYMSGLPLGVLIYDAIHASEFEPTASNNRRGTSDYPDENEFPLSVNPGKKDCGQCNKCPGSPPPTIHEVPGHGCPGRHMHIWGYNQDLETCECFRYKGSKKGVNLFCLE